MAETLQIPKGQINKDNFVRVLEYTGDKYTEFKGIKAILGIGSETGDFDVDVSTNTKQDVYNIKYTDVEDMTQTLTISETTILGGKETLYDLLDVIRVENAFEELTKFNLYLVRADKTKDDGFLTELHKDCTISLPGIKTEGAFLARDLEVTSSNVVDMVITTSTLKDIFEGKFETKSMLETRSSLGK